MKKIKRTFVSYPVEVGWRVNAKFCRVPSAATEGNILEAINTALTLLQFHYMDRDLHRTGNSIVIISAGSGVFEVNKSLAAITKQRMIDNGIGKLHRVNLSFHCKRLKQMAINTLLLISKGVTC